VPGGVDIIVIVIQLWTVSAHGWGGEGGVWYDIKFTRKINPLYYF